MRKKTHPVLIAFGLFLASVLGGFLAGYLLQPREACAQCVQIPQLSGIFVNGTEDTYGADVNANVADTCDGNATTIYACPANVSRTTCVDTRVTGTYACGRTICTSRAHRDVTCRAFEVAGVIH